ncbi:MAG: methyltransferase domain-containing protein [Burkholderiales bacterium]
MSVRKRLRHWLAWHGRRALRTPPAATEGPGRQSPAPAAEAGNPEVAALAAHYEERVREFYAYLPADVKDLFIGDALYHKVRYLDMLSQPFGAEIVELGSDKPFITHHLRTMNPGARVHTISIDIPFSPYPITRIDIESEPFPFADGSVSDVVFTEVLEHLFRDPAWTIAEIARVLKIGGRLFLTTPNACGYDVLVNLLSQVNPNGRNQFYESIESGHPHLWTAGECRALLEAHGFGIESLSTVDYYDMPLPGAVRAFLAANSADPARNGQVLRIVAEKKRAVAGVVYPEALFPQGHGVRLSGALRKWAERALKEGDGR